MWSWLAFSSSLQFNSIGTVCRFHQIKAHVSRRAPSLHRIHNPFEHLNSSVLQQAHRFNLRFEACYLLGFIACDNPGAADLTYAQDILTWYRQLVSWHRIPAANVKHADRQKNKVNRLGIFFRRKFEARICCCPEPTHIYGTTIFAPLRI